VQQLDIPNEAFPRLYVVRHLVEDIDMLYSGIDLHKHSLVIHTVGEDGSVVREAEFATTRAALTAYLATLPGPHRAVVECLGSWYWVRDLLGPQGIDLRLAHAKYLKAISYAKVKTDRVDARTLAQLLRVGLVPEAHMISPELREVRDLLRARLKLVTRATRARHAITGLFTQYNVRATRELPALVQLQVELLEDEQALLAAQVKRCERELRPRLLPRADVQRLVWIPGVGAIIAYMLVLEIDDIHRFPTARHFHSYCRLVPGADNSAGKTHHKRSRDGNRYLKLAFHQAAVRAIQYVPEIKQEYQRWRRRKGKAIGRALVAKELATIVYAVLKKGEPFNGTFHGHVLTTQKRRQWPRLANPPA
jgi:transposase